LTLNPAAPSRGDAAALSAKGSEPGETIMAASVYEQHDKAFARVSAWVVLDDKGERVATVAIKFPQDGAGRLWAYAHVLGLPMQRHHADGYGYDKRSPAVRGAFTKAAIPSSDVRADSLDWCATMGERIRALREAVQASDGEYWDRLLEKAGFRVLQAV
jgi:hypothetical protein